MGVRAALTLTPNPLPPAGEGAGQFNHNAWGEGELA